MNTKPIAFNTVCEFEDFSDPELGAIMRDVFRHEVKRFSPDFPHGAEHRKYWEIAMAIRALRHYGALGPESVLLGIGAGTETTLFYLTNHARQVFATDLYLNPGMWGSNAPDFMLVEPERVAPYPFQRQRLVVQHMDARRLEYPDNTFDGIFSSGSIEHYGDFTDIANAAYEMGRVLKPGGIASLSTEYLIEGPRNGSGWNGLRFLSRKNIQRYIIEASGLEPVDELDLHLSRETMKIVWDSSALAKEIERQRAQQSKVPRGAEVIVCQYPHLVLRDRRYVFCSIHLTLRKDASYASAQNNWARVSREGPLRTHSSATRRQRLLALIARFRGQS